MSTSRLEPVVRQIRQLAVGELPDATLLGRFVADGDQDAFAELLRRHAALVWRVCRRVLGRAEGAEDALQATFLILARKANSIRKPGALAPWLHGVAYRVAREARRRDKPQEAWAEPASPARDPSQEAAWRELGRLLEEEVQRLPEKLRLPLLLSYWEGKTNEAAASELGWASGTFKARLARARIVLHQRLLKRGVTLPVGAIVLLIAPGAADAVPPAALLTATPSATATALAETVLAGSGAYLLVALALILALATSLGAVALTASHEPPPAAPPALAAAPDAPPVDADGRPLPEGAVQRLGSRRFRVAGHCSLMLPTPEGRYLLVQPEPLLTGHDAHGLMLLDPDTGLNVRSFEDGGRVLRSTADELTRPAAFSPDGKKLYGLGWHKPLTGPHRFDQDGHLDRPAERVLLVWDVATGRRSGTWELPPGNKEGASLLGVQVSPDGRRLYVYGAIRMETDAEREHRGVDGIHVLDAATGKHLQTWEGAGCPIGTIADGQEVLTVRRETTLAAHDAASGKVVRTYPLTGTLPSVALSADGQTLAALEMDITRKAEQRAARIKLLDARTGRELRHLAVDVKKVAGGNARLVFAADGKTLYLGSKGTIQRWDLAKGEALPAWKGPRSRITDLYRWPGKQELVAVDWWEGLVYRWDTATGRTLTTTTAYRGGIATARLPDGKGLVVVDETGRLDVWDVTNGRRTKTLQTPGRGRHALIFTPAGTQLLVATERGPNTLWDLATDKQVGTLVPPPAPQGMPDAPYGSGSWQFSADGKYLVATKYGCGSWLWSWPQRELLWHTKDIRGFTFLPDGQALLAAAWEGVIELRDPRTGAVRQTLPGTGMLDVAFDTSRRLMVTTHIDGAWQVRDLSTGAILKEVSAFKTAWCVSLSPTGWLLAVAGDNDVRVYDTASWQEVGRYTGHEGTVYNLFFGADDATLVSVSSEDGTALVWSLRPSAGRPPEPAALWADLAGDGPAVRRAVWGAAQHPEVAIPLFRAKWPPRAVDRERLRQLIGQLDSDRFAAREEARAELAKIGRQAVPEMRAALARPVSVEVRQRLRKLLEPWSAPPTIALSAEQARVLRAVWALELAGTTEARRLLEAWAAALTGDRLGEAALAAVERSRRKGPR